MKHKEQAERMFGEADDMLKAPLTERFAELEQRLAKRFPSEVVKAVLAEALDAALAVHEEKMKREGKA